MNIGNINSTNFGSIKLFKAQLIRENILGEKKPIRAYISLLEKSDLKRLDLKDDNWLDNYGEKTFGNDIIWDLRRKDKSKMWDDYYFVGVECPDEQPGRKIKALAEAIKCEKNLKLSLLQSQTALENLDEKTNGAGACIIYFLTKLAQKLNKDKIKVVSFDDFSTAFYKKFGFEQDYKDIYIMPDPAITNVQKDIEKKYNIRPVSRKKHPII